MINSRLAAIFIALLFSSCLVHKRGMYLSPLDSQTVPYHTIPFKSDSLKSAIYGSMVYSSGINGVKTLRRIEWRFLGLETSIRKEFGDYYKFRENLADTAANIIFRNNLTALIGYIPNRFGVTGIIRNMDSGSP